MPSSNICHLLLLAGLLAACRPDPGETAPRPLAPTPNKRGIHLLLDDGRSAWPESRWPEHLRYAREAVGEWGYVTQVIRSDDLDVEKWQRFMDLCADLRLTPILRLATTYNRERGWWERPPTGLGGGYRDIARRYAEFAAALDWPTETRLVIVGNEPNHGEEWGGVPDPAGYARFLIDSAEALHDADPGARVLNAGFDPYAPDTDGQPLAETGMVYASEAVFIDAMLEAEPEVFAHLDAWASHAYPLGPFRDPPWQQAGDPESGTRRLGVNGYEWELWKLSTLGIDDLPALITETGWRHAESSDPAATDSTNATLDAATVALYFELAFDGNGGRYPDLPDSGWTPWLDDPRVIAVTPFALDGHPAEWGHSNWLILDGEGAVLGTYPVIERRDGPAAKSCRQETEARRCFLLPAYSPR